MAFIEELVFPEDISYGSEGGPGWNTEVVVMTSGFEQRDQKWSLPRYAFNAVYGVKTGAQMRALHATFHQARGMTHGFRYKDWADYEATDEPLTLDGTPTAQLQKTYGSGAYALARTIKKPRATPAATFTRGGAPYATPTVDTATGQVTFLPDATSAASSITVGATTQVVLASNPGTLTAGQKLYLSGFTGADAALINGLAHTINSVSGSGPYTFTLATNTAGKTITLGSGLGAKYPQPSETITWTGEFDVPVRFDTDRLPARFDDYESNSANVPLIEDRNA